MPFSFILFIMFFSALFSSALAGEGKEFSILSMHDNQQPASMFSYANPNAPKGGTIRFCEIGTFDSLNRHIVKGKPAAGNDLVTERLMARDFDAPFSLAPRIVKKVEMPKDRDWIIFYLDPKATFQDGHPVKAEDVVFSYEVLKAKGRPNFKNAYRFVKKVTVLDSHTVRFDFSKEANRETPMVMGLMPLFAKHVWKDKDFTQTTLNPFLGSGPYKITYVEPGKQIVYERIKTYWGRDIPTAIGHYNFDKIIYDYYRDDTVALQAFQSGMCDFRREEDMMKWMNGYELNAVHQGKIIKEALPHKRAETVKALIFNTRVSLFEDIRVRQALFMALDRDWINEKFFQDSMKKTNSIYPNSELAFSNQDWLIGHEQSIRQRLRKGAELLEEAGWIVQDGKRYHKKTGEQFRFEILLQDNKNEKIALNFARNLKRLGIEVSVRLADTAQFFNRLNEYDFEMVLFQWHSTLSPGTEQFFYWGSNAADIKGARNYPGIKDVMVDLLINQLVNVESREELIQIARNLDQKIMSGYYFIPLFYDANDKVSYWQSINRPDYNPIYGPVLETWWHEVIYK